MPIQLRSNTAASEYPHAVLLQLGNQRSDNLSTLIEPSINAASIYRLSFSETIKNSNNKRFAHKDILIGPNTKRTTIHALLYKTLMHGEVKAVPQYINFAIFLILSLFLVNLFAKNDDRMHIIFISSCIANITSDLESCFNSLFKSFDPSFFANDRNYTRYFIFELFS